MADAIPLTITFDTSHGAARAQARSPSQGPAVRLPLPPDLVQRAQSTLETLRRRAEELLFEPDANSAEGSPVRVEWTDQAISVFRPNSVVYAEFDAARVRVVQTVEVAPGQKATISSYLDRACPENSYLEVRGLGPAWARLLVSDLASG